MGILRSPGFFKLIDVLLVISLFACIFFLPVGYTYKETCPLCEGKGKYDQSICKKCGGKGFIVHWMYNITGATILFSLIGILSFLGFFCLYYLATDFYLSFNSWVYDVDDMDARFNPMFTIWLFAKDRKRWAKQSTSVSLLVSLYMGTLIFWIVSLKQITRTTFISGILLGAAIVTLFSLAFYKAYTLKIESSQQREQYFT